MNIFKKAALQRMKKNRTQTLVTIIGVALSAAMVTAVVTFGVSLLRYMADGAAQKYGSWHAAFLDADPAFAQERMRDEAVAGTTSFQNIGYAALDGGKDPAYLFIAGYQRETFDALPTVLLSGRLPENSGEALISGKLAKNGVSLAVGDTLTLQVGNRMKGDRKLGQNDPYTAGMETFVPQGERTYTVVGVCQTPVYEEDASPGYTLITRADAADAADSLSLFVTLKNPHRVHAYVEAVSPGRAAVLNHRVLRFMGLSDDPADQMFHALLYAVGGIVVAIIMIGSIFLIYNAFSISLNERTRQIGILSSVGATAKQLRASVLFEGLCIGAVGIPVGVLAGVGGIGLVISVVSKNFGSILYAGVPLTLRVSFPAIAGAVAVSIVTILISAYLPARKAAGMPVMDCIRQTNEVEVDPRAVKTSKLAQRVYGLEGTLALKNFKRNKKRYRSIVLSLALSVVLFVSTSAFVTYLKQASEQAKVVTDYDIGFGTQDMDDGALLRLYEQLKSVGGIDASNCQALIECTCAVPAAALSDAYWEAAGGRTPGETVRLPLEIQFLDDGTYLKIVGELGLPVQEYTGQTGKMLAVAKMQDHGGRADGVGRLDDVFTAAAITGTLEPAAGGGAQAGRGEPVGITLVEVVPPDTPPTMEGAEPRPYVFQAMAPWSRKETLFPPQAPGKVRVKGLTFLSENPSRSAAEMKAVIQGAAVTSSYILLNTSEALDESRNYIFIANVFAYTFIVMMSLIAAANVFNTISTNIKLRRQELAMLRSMGMSDRDFTRMMRFECVFYGMRALLYGLPLSAAACLLIYRGMFAGGMEGVDFVLPWASIGVSVCSVLLVIFATMMYATSKLRRENIIDALRDDMA